MSTSASSVEFITGKIKDLLQDRDPSKVSDLQHYLTKYRGREADLYLAFCEKYKVEANPDIKKMSTRKQIKEIYSIGEKLGTGGFAVVRKCKRKADSKYFALKVINKKNLDKEDLVILETEVNIMRQMNHTNIVKLHDVFDSRSKMCLVLDLMSGGELFDRIIEKGHFTEADAADAFSQMCDSLAYIHSLRIVHRDLKPENLLFESRDDHSPIKLIDFGLAGQTKPNKFLSTPCGTPNYVAPEILRREPYGTQSDMWSTGVILYIILCGFPPFYDENDNLNRLYRKIKRAEYDMPSPFWDDISDDAKDLVQKLLQPDPKKRLTAEEALQHPWTKKAPATVMNPKFHDHLKRFQYIRRLRRGVRCVCAVLRLISVLSDG